MDKKFIDHLGHDIHDENFLTDKLPRGTLRIAYKDARGTPCSDKVKFFLFL